VRWLGGVAPGYQVGRSAAARTETARTRDAWRMYVSVGLGGVGFGGGGEWGGAEALAAAGTEDGVWGCGGRKRCRKAALTLLIVGCVQCAEEVIHIICSTLETDHDTVLQRVRAASAGISISGAFEGRRVCTLLLLLCR